MMGASMQLVWRLIVALALSAMIATGLASAAFAQPGRPSKADLKAPPVLPKMAPAPTIAGVVKEADAENIWLLDLSVGGRVKIVLRPDAAPNSVARIKTLTRSGFYDGTVFHRVIDGFMAQGGDPTGTGQGGSKFPDLTAEFNDLPHVRGAVSMARAQSDDSANSQFFLVFQPVLKLDRTYTVFGRVADGMQYVDAIQRGEPPGNPTRILKASMANDNVPPPAPQTPIPASATTDALKSLGLPSIDGLLPAGTPAPPPKR
jgi:peptidylprolyl isomerase